ncbi:MAG: hypothetical protein HQL43_00355 [Alphaproteobacteria bacterium]|nr:hypothetical protein [Alphaproteobacteria bacterium]
MMKKLSPALMLAALLTGAAPCAVAADEATPAERIDIEFRQNLNDRLKRLERKDNILTILVGTVLLLQAALLLLTLCAHRNREDASLPSDFKRRLDILRQGQTQLQELATQINGDRQRLLELAARQENELARLQALLDAEKKK